MNEVEIRIIFESLSLKDEITIPCSTCGSPQHVRKDTAIDNARRHKDIFLCRKCSYTDDGRKRIAKANSYKRSKSTCSKMSLSANEKWQTDWGKRQRKILAKKATQQHSSSNPDKSKRKILYISTKNNGEIKVCNSSYEFIACEYLLEKDVSIKRYDCQVPYTIECRERSLDFLVEYKDGTKEIIEIKPKKRLNEECHSNQIKDSKANAERLGYSFKVWTEEDLGIRKSKEATALADAYRKEHYLIDYATYRAEKDRIKGRRHYENKIREDKVLTFCSFCNTYHLQLKITYEKNIRKNGKFICIHENGYLVGKKPKLHLRKENPYVDQGMKQCTGPCKRILLFECFGTDKSRRDGYASRCKECRNKINAE